MTINQSKNAFMQQLFNIKEKKQASNGTWTRTSRAEFCYATPITSYSHLYDKTKRVRQAWICYREVPGKIKKNEASKHKKSEK